jgi:hypothetical protein
MSFWDSPLHICSLHSQNAGWHQKKLMHKERMRHTSDAAHKIRERLKIRELGKMLAGWHQKKLMLKERMRHTSDV